MKKILFVAAMLVAFITHATTPESDGGKKSKKYRTSSKGSGKKLNVGVAIGATMPTGDFASTAKRATNDTTNVNGFAKTGIHFNVHAGYLFSKYVGAMVMIGGNINSFNTKAYDADYNTSSGSYPSGNAVTTATSHYVGQYMVGPYLSLPVGNKFSVEVRALFGLTTSSYAKITETNSQPGLTVTDVFQFKAGAAFGYSVGAGAKYMFNEKMGLTFNVAYSGSSMSYASYTETISGYPAPFTTLNGSSTRTAKRDMSIGMINTSIGIVFAF